MTLRIYFKEQRKTGLAVMYNFAYV